MLTKTYLTLVVLF